ncbi:MAG: hypothetical protein K2H29_09280 [Oscillospiraceae bacterium]|nr:hypothetical protein [Oscillospiraceae bacterium]
MNSVTGRINEIKQPRGGYIKPSEFEVTVINDDFFLNEKENIHGSIIGLVVDYLTRFALGENKEKAFEVSLIGAVCAEKLGSKKSLNNAKKLLKGINGLDNNSVVNACKLVTFDVWYRNPMFATMSKNYKDTNPDEPTIQNIQVLVKRSMVFFDKYGKITKDGFTFEPMKQDEKAFQKMIESGKGSYGGYTATVSSGDGDFLTKDTLWDFKVSKSKPTSKHTLQLLMYWIMGQHSGQEIYKKIIKLGIFNPRLNTVYLLDMQKVSKDVIKIVENEIICYE